MRWLPEPRPVPRFDPVLGDDFGDNLRASLRRSTCLWADRGPMPPSTPRVSCHRRGRGARINGSRQNRAPPWCWNADTLALAGGAAAARAAAGKRRRTFPSIRIRGTRAASQGAPAGSPAGYSWPTSRSSLGSASSCTVEPSPVRRNSRDSYVTIRSTPCQQRVTR